jgi:hypothetical protein
MGEERRGNSRASRSGEPMNAASLGERPDRQLF